MLAKTLSALALAVALLLGDLVVASPAQAAPTCYTTVKQVTVNGVKKTRLSVVGPPFNRAKVYSFQLNWGWKLPRGTTSTYIPRYRTYDAPRHTPLNWAKSWVNGYRCKDWNAADLF